PAAPAAASSPAPGRSAASSAASAVLEHRRGLRYGRRLLRQTRAVRRAFLHDHRAAALIRGSRLRLLRSTIFAKMRSGRPESYPATPADTPHSGRLRGKSPHQAAGGRFSADRGGLFALRRATKGTSP